MWLGWLTRASVLSRQIENLRLASFNMENIGLDMYTVVSTSIALDDLPKDPVEIPNGFQRWNLGRSTDRFPQELWDALAKINRSEVKGVWWSEVRRAK